jgi:hypothetical protein
MKILVATKKTQGQRDNDFFWTKENELVYLGFECGSGGREADSYCGCVRDFNGLETKKGTTTALVLDLNTTPEKIAELFAAQGYENQVEEMLTLADRFNVGEVVEKRGPTYGPGYHDEQFMFENFQARIPG